MKGGRVMNQRESNERLEESRRLRDDGSALMIESLEKPESESELSQKMFDEGTELWKKGCKMRLEAAEENECSETKACEKQHPKNCGCKQCQVAEPFKHNQNRV